LLAGRLGLLLANVVTILGITQYQGFVQIQALDIEICGDINNFHPWAQLLAQRNQTIYLDLKYTHHCRKKDSTFRDYVIQSDDFSIFITLSYAHITDINIPIKDAPRPYQIKIAREPLIVFQSPAEHPDMFEKSGPYVVQLDQSEATIVIFLIPAKPDSNTVLKRQLACRETDWPSWVKSIACPFIPVR
jgi:hypothetical protein